MHKPRIIPMPSTRNGYPAHIAAPPRITASMVRRYGSYDAASQAVAEQ